MRHVVSGRVRGPDGAPVVGALVAAVPVERLGLTLGRAGALAQSREEGRFRFELPPGRYGLTATAQGLTAGFGGQVTAGEAGAAREVEVTLGREGVTVSGTVRSPDGGPAGGAVVWATRWGADDGYELHTLADAEGRYAMKLEPGSKYMFRADLPGFESNTQGARLGADGSFDLSLRPCVIPSSSESQFVAWLRDNAAPLDTLELERGFADLRRVQDVIGDARVVGVGESTHGTREFFQFRHRLFEYLASELGFTVYVIEANLPGTLAVNDYVLHGKGDAVSALAETFMWVHDTQEMLEFIEWMRRYNADPKHPRKLKFYGLDADHPQKASRVVLDYLREVDPGSVAPVEALVGPISRQRAYWKDLQALSDAQKARLREGLAALLRRFDENKAAWAARTGAQRWALARHHVRLFEQIEEDARVRSFARVRDAHMAENVRWILEQEGPDARMVVTAHNGHVYFSDFPTRPMGWHLRQAMGRGYRVIGSFFNQGGVQAIPWQATMPDRRLSTSEFVLGPAPEGSLDRMLSKAGHPQCLVDLRRASGPIGEWFQTRLVTRAVEASFSNEANTETSMITSEGYDALFFVDRMTRARPNPPR
ncbi:erythromycin esterase family protein [Myxococcaceae bacterium GXIMD 01537]